MCVVSERETFSIANTIANTPKDREIFSSGGECWGGLICDIEKFLTSDKMWNKTLWLGYLHTKSLQIFPHEKSFGSNATFLCVEILIFKFYFNKIVCVLLKLILWVLLSICIRNLRLMKETR